METDILVVGTYEPREPIFQWLLEKSISIPKKNKPFEHAFDVNRKQYPQGRAFALPARVTYLEQLAIFSEHHLYSEAKPLFDHLLVFRSGNPVVPLLNFHDAFAGGDLYLSGLYAQKSVYLFAKKTNAVAKRMMNPA